MKLFKVTYDSSSLFVIAPTQGAVLVYLVTNHGFTKEMYSDCHISLVEKPNTNRKVV